MKLAIGVAMSAEELRRRLRDGVKAKRSFRELRALVVDFAAVGGRRDIATAVLDALHHELGDDDAVLDLMDVACGFCDPSLRIWSDDAHRRSSAPR